MVVIVIVIVVVVVVVIVVVVVAGAWGVCAPRYVEGALEDLVGVHRPVALQQPRHNITPPRQ